MFFSPNSDSKVAPQVPCMHHVADWMLWLRCTESASRFQPGLCILNGKVNTATRAVPPGPLAFMDDTAELSHCQETTDSLLLMPEYKAVVSRRRKGQGWVDGTGEGRLSLC